MGELGQGTLSISLVSGHGLEMVRRKMDQLKFFEEAAQSYAILCMPGLGYDTYRLWETLFLGYCFVALTKNKFHQTQGNACY